MEQPVKKKAIRTTPAEVLYIIFYCVILAGKVLGLSEDSYLYKALLLTGLILLIAKTLISAYTRQSFILTIAIYSMAIVSYIRSEDLGILLCCAILAGINGCQLRHVLIPVSCLWGGAFVFMTIATQTGLLPDQYLIHNKAGLGYIVRSSFGYPHPNVLHISFLMITCLILADYGKTKTFKLTILLFLINCYIFIFSVSFTGFLITTFYLLLNTILKMRPASSQEEGHIWHFLDLLMLLAFPFCVLFSVAGPVLFHGSLYDLCDRLVHHRFVLSNFYLTQEKFSLFGHILLNTPDANRSIDCSYVYLLVHNGWIPFLFFCASYMIAIWSSIREREYQYTCVLLACTIAGVTEPFLFNTSFKNVSLLFVGNFLFHLLQPQTENEKKICLFPSLQRKIPLKKVVSLHQSLQQLYPKVLSRCRKHKKKICLISTGSCICTLFIAFQLLPRYTGVLIPAEYCSDGYPSPGLYCSAEELYALHQKGIRLLSCEPGKELALFLGRTALYENIRFVINLTVCVLLMVLAITVLSLCMHDLRSGSSVISVEDSFGNKRPSC